MPACLPRRRSMWWGSAHAAALIAAACGSDRVADRPALVPGWTVATASDAASSAGPRAIDTLALPEPETPTCEAPLSLALEQLVVGDSRRQPPLGDASCGGSEGQPALPYRVDSGPGVLVIEAEAVDANVDGVADWDLVLSLREDCADPATEVACAAGAARLVHCVGDAGTTTVLVGGAGEAALRPEHGRFTIGASAKGPCGPGERCVEGVGCALELAGGDADRAVPLPIGQTVTATTAGAADDVYVCGAEAPDVVYSLDADTLSFLTVELQPAPGFAGALALRREGDEYGSDFCGGFPGRASACVSEGSWSVVVEDGEASPDAQPAGPFALTAHLASCAEGEVCRPGIGCVDLLPGGETCDDAVTLPSLDGRWAGSTTGAADDLPDSCGDGMGADVVYALDAETTGLLALSLQPAEPGALTMSLRDGCAEASSEISCGDVTECVAPGHYLVVVDAARDAEGAPREGHFALSSSFTPCPVDQRCTTAFGGPCVADRTGGDVCDDAVPLPIGMRVGGTTEGLGDDDRVSCLAGASGGDVVYSIDARVDGLLSWELSSSSFAAAAALRRDCTDGDDELVCGAFVAPTCVSAGAYSLIVDGSDGGHGTAREGEYTLLARFEACAPGRSCIDGACRAP